MRTLLVGTLLSVCLVGAGAAQPPMPVRVGGNIKPPAKVRDVRPVYPPIAQSARVAGIVILEAVVDTDGTVTQARVLRGVPLLNDAALDAVKQWQYEPTLLNGVAVPVIMTVTVNFSLQDNMEGGAMVAGGPASDLPPPPLVDPTLPTAPASDAFVLSPGRAGVVDVGLSPDELYQRIPRTQVRLVDRFTNGRFAPAFEIALQPGERAALIAEIGRADWRISRIEVRDVRFRTADGLGVGSTLAELRARDPNLRMVNSQFGVLADVGGSGVMYALEQRANGTDPRTLPDTTRVFRVFLANGSPLGAVR